MTHTHPTPYRTLSIVLWVGCAIFILAWLTPPMSRVLQQLALTDIKPVHKQLILGPATPSHIRSMTGQPAMTETVQSTSLASIIPGTVDIPIVTPAQQSRSGQWSVLWMSVAAVMFQFLRRYLYNNVPNAKTLDSNCTKSFVAADCEMDNPKVWLIAATGDDSEVSSPESAISNEPNTDPPQLPYRPFLPLFLFGFLVGPLVDGIHNQALLSYDVLPVTVPFPFLPADIVFKTSILVPPLLGVSYAVLGALLPDILRVPPPSPIRTPITRAALSCLALLLITRASALLLNTPLPAWLSLALLMGAAVEQWASLDGRRSILALALVVSIGGPLAEVPFVMGGLWHYLNPDIYPLPFLDLPYGLASITAPCYFATTQAAVLVGDYLRSLRSKSSS